jgi:hypothetical protein
MREQQAELGPSRFRVVEYEDFCNAPETVIGAVGREVLGVEIDETAVRAALPSFRSTNRVSVSAADFDEIQRTLTRLGA